MPPESLQSLIALVLGFAVAGLLTSGFKLITERQAGFELLSQSPYTGALAAVPFLVFAAPFIIMRNTLVGARVEGRRFQFVFLATLIAGFWSLMSGTVVVLSLQALGVIAA